MAMTKRANRQTDDITAETSLYLEEVEELLIEQALADMVNDNPVGKTKKGLRELGSQIHGRIGEILKDAGEKGGFDPSELIKEDKKNIAVAIETVGREYSKAKSTLKTLAKVDFFGRQKITKEWDGEDEFTRVTMQSVDKAGRTLGYKERMERTVRTLVSKEIGEQQLEFGGKAKIVFYISNEFADCADDHKDYQGKMYYDERWRSFNLDDEITKKIESAISGMKSVQEVREGPPYLTTRPNCRHSLVPISIDQALNYRPSKLVEDLQISTGSYKPDHYEALQEQRANERRIRKYKREFAKFERLEESYSHLEGGAAFHRREINKIKAKIRRSQRIQKQHVAKHPNLKRDYRRENPARILQDAGVKYNREKKLKAETFVKGPDPSYGLVHGPQDPPEKYEMPRDSFNALKHQAGKTWKRLSARENGYDLKESIVGYTGDSYAAVNSLLRFGDRFGELRKKYFPSWTREEAEEQAELLKEAFQFTESFDNNVQIRRDTELGLFAEMFGFDRKELRTLITKHALDDGKEFPEFVGKLSVDKGFGSYMSHTGPGDFANHREIQIVANLRKDTPAMYVEPVSAFGQRQGVDWDGEEEKENSYIGENEVVVGAGASYFFRKVSMKRGRLVVEVDIFKDVREDEVD